MCLKKVLKVFLCGFSLLPGRSSDKISFQQPQLAEQNPVDKRHGGQLLQGEMGLKLEFLLFHKESHCWCFSLSQVKLMKNRKKTKAQLNLREKPFSCINLCFHGFCGSLQMIQYRNLKRNQVLLVNSTHKRRRRLTFEI